MRSAYLVAREPPRELLACAPVPEALFERESETTWRPSELTRGPWSPDALHGGPVAALLVHLVEALPRPGPMHPARVTVELLRPVPLAPLQSDARVLRAGRKVQLTAASLHGGGKEVARASVLWIRSAALPLPARTAAGPVSAPPSHEGRPSSRPAWRGEARAYHSHAVEHRIVRGTWGAIGPCTDWIRLRVPVVEGATPTPLERVAAVADFGNGIGCALPFETWRFLNPDLTIHLQRLPEGEWVCLDAATWPEGEGVGLAESELFDVRGRLGRALQSLLLERA
jgi:acyl-coenzyme A thioesterase PaaI-like protein